MSKKPASGVGARLRMDLRREKLSVRGLARTLAGPDATNDDVERWRRYVSRWLALEGDRGMNPTNAEMIARVLGTKPERYLSPMFSPREQLERRVARLQADLRKARDELAQLPKP